MKNKNNLKELFKYAGWNKYLTISSWVLSSISALLALVPFIYIWLIIKEAIDVMPDFSKAQNLAHNGWMSVIFAVASVLVYFAALMCSHLSAFRIASNIRSKCIHHISRLPVGYVEGIGSGKLRKIIDESSAATETYLAHQLPDMSGSIATPLGMIILLFLFDWRLGFLCLIPVIVAFSIMTKMTGKGMAHKMKEYTNALEDMNNEAVEYIRGIPVVKTFGQTVFSFRRFKGSIDRYSKWVLDYTKSLRSTMLKYILSINSVFVLLIAAGITATNDVSNEFLLNLLFYIIFTPIITVMMTKIMFMSENGMITRDALERINSILNAKPLSETEKPELPADNSIELKNITFRYDGAETDAVNNITLKVNSGETVALVGPSGGGKTSVAGLISRFWDVNSGEIKIGGVNVKNISKEKLNQTVSFVFQDSKLLKTSILENVRLSKPKASREEVQKALYSAQCKDIIDKLPSGIDTVIGSKGIYLSGGEQQRIAIARTILKNSPVVILDEATAFADPENEYLVQKAFENLSKNRTVIMIAHRLTTIRNADCIYVLKDGKISERGTHNELINNKNIYAKMWNEYQTSISWKIAKEV
jgi:ATP-binding cassette subfamily B protein